MTLAPLANSPLPIQAHAAGAVLALLIGVAQLVMRKGTPRHRLVGYVWCGLMILVALTSFWIHQIRLWGLFSPIHLLSILTLAGIPRAIWLARRGDIRGHRRLMLILFWTALVGAGLFTLFPGRIMNAVILN